ncbi:MAG: tetratricopeptide repeat protein [Chthonomonadales bacterium]
MKHTIRFVIVGIGASAAITALTVSCAKRPEAITATPAIRASWDPSNLQKSIAFYETRVKRDPRAAIESSALSGLYLDRYRETADAADVARAERFARHSLQIRKKNNASGFIRLAQALNAQHRFKEALAVLDEGHAGTEEGIGRSLRADILMELGRYSEAANTLKPTQAIEGNDELLRPVRARFLGLSGKSDEAITEMQRTTRESDANFDVTAPQAAWFHMRTGDMLSGRGRYDEAQSEYKTAVALFPRDFRSFTGLARMALEQRDYVASAKWSSKALEIVPSIDALAIAESAATATGNTSAASSLRSQIDAIARIQRSAGIVYDRQLANYYADHGMNLPVALSLARKELKARQDIYAWDTLAWCAYKNGKLNEAVEASGHALATGAQDAKLLLHAALINREAGRISESASCTRKCIAANPTYANSNGAPALLSSLETAVLKPANHEVTR